MLDKLLLKVGTLDKFEEPEERGNRTFVLFSIKNIDKHYNEYMFDDYNYANKKPDGKVSTFVEIIDKNGYRRYRLNKTIFKTKLGCLFKYTKDGEFRKKGLSEDYNLFIRGVKDYSFRKFWNALQFKNHLILNKDSSVAFDYNKVPFEETCKLDEEGSYEDLKERFICNDKFDNEEIIVTCYKSSRTWEYGGSYYIFRLLMKLFKNDVTDYDIEIKFNKGVGAGKDSWKGGVVGAGFNLKDTTETIEDALKRFCEDRHYINFGRKI